MQELTVNSTAVGFTPHKIEVIVSGENVTSAVIDGKWDELSQQPVFREPDLKDTKNITESQTHQISTSLDIL